MFEMRKEIYLVQGEPQEYYSSFSERILSLAKELSESLSVDKLKVTYTKEAAPKLSIIPFKKKKIAAISVFKKDADPVKSILEGPGFVGGYVVEEAIPVGYSKSWQDASVTPGICLLTLFKQKKGLSHKDFIDRWHNGHTPLSLEIHPLWNYNRNVVKDILGNESPRWDGIVEEQFREKSELLNPVKFFGNPLIMPYRMWQVYADTKSFLDYKSIEPYFAHEYWVKS